MAKPQTASTDKSSVRDSFPRRFRQGFLLAFVGLVVVGCIASYKIGSMKRDASKFTNTFGVIADLKNLDLQLTRCEDEVRGYLITHDQQFLVMYEKSKSEANSQLEVLKPKLKDNSSQYEKFEKLSPIITQCFYLLDSTGNNTPQALEQITRSSRENIHSIRLGLAELISVEETHLKDRQDLASWRASEVEWSLMLGISILAILLLMGIIYNVAPLRTKECVSHVSSTT